MRRERQNEQRKIARIIAVSVLRGGEDIEVNETILPGDTEKSYNIGCPDCGVWYDWIFDSEKEAIEAWNRRAHE